MKKHYVEHWPATAGIASVASEIARHLQVRQSLGSAIIMAERPLILLSAVRKNWIKLTRAIQLEKSRTLDASLRAALSQELEMMQQLRFVAKMPHENEADVFFVELSKTMTIPSACRTLYTNLPSSEDFGRFLKELPSGSVIVQYSLQDKN